jgi:hypothetical protein
MAGLGSTVGNPGDVQIGVGPTAVVQMVNSSIAVWSKAGSTIAPAPSSTLSMGAFFSTPSHNRTGSTMSDPRVLFDAPTGRWFFAGFDVDRRETVLAVSSSTEPLSSRTVLTIPSSGCPDQPRLGVSDRLIALGLDVFTSCQEGGTRVGGQIVLVDKQAMLAGAASVSKYGPDARFSAVTPAQSLTPTTTQFFASTDYATDSVVLYTATAVSQPSIPVSAVRIRPIAFAPPAPQAGTSAPIDVGDSRVQDSFWENGTIWLAANDGCTAGGVLRGCGRFVAITTATGAVVRDVEEALSENRHLFYPAIRSDNAGNLFAVFGFSSANEFPSLGAVINPGTASGWSILTRGTGPNLSGRWGDYFGAARDPSEPARVWVSGQVGSSRGPQEWNSAIAALAASPFTISGPPAPAPAGDTQAPQVQAVASSGRRGAVAHLRYRVFEDSGESRETVRILRGTSAVASTVTTFGSVENGALYYTTWRVPKRLRPGRLKFCVTSFDRAGNRSGPSCAALTIR